LRDRALWIPDQSSLFPSQVFSVGKSMPRDIAKELQDGVLEAAEVKPGMGIKAQINAACENLAPGSGTWSFDVKTIMAGFYAKARDEGNAAAELAAVNHMVAAAAYLDQVSGRAKALRVLRATIKTIELG
jgi:hypothetical protein